MYILQKYKTVKMFDKFFLTFDIFCIYSVGKWMVWIQYSWAIGLMLNYWTLWRSSSKIHQEKLRNLQKDRFIVWHCTSIRLILHLLNWRRRDSIWSVNLPPSLTVSGYFLAPNLKKHLKSHIRTMKMSVRLLSASFGISHRTFIRQELQNCNNHENLSHG